MPDNSLHINTLLVFSDEYVQVNGVLVRENGLKVKR
jgi:hypothetical protein